MRETYVEPILKIKCLDYRKSKNAFYLKESKAETTGGSKQHRCELFLFPQSNLKWIYLPLLICWTNIDLWKLDGDNSLKGNWIFFKGTVFLKIYHEWWGGGDSLNRKLGGVKIFASENDEVPSPSLSHS